MAFWLRLSLIIAIGITARVLYTVLVAPWPPPFGDDAWFFHYEAILLAQGHGFVNVGQAMLGVTRPSAAHPPLYPLVLAGLAKLGGTDQVVQRLAGSAFGAGTIVLLALLGRRLAGERTGLIAALLAAAYPVLITADGALLSESLYGLLLAACLLAAYRLRDEPSVRRAAALGVLLGLAALTRGEALLLLPLMLVPVIRRARGWRAALVVCCTVLVVLAPWTVRNWTVFDRPVLISTDLASAVAGANCHSSYYTSKIGSWDNACVKTYPGNEASAYDRSEADALHYARDHASRLPVLIAARLARVWGLRRNLLPGSKLPQLADRSPVVLELGFVMYYVLVALSVCGVVLLRRRSGSVWLLISPFVLVTIAAALIYGDVRFRQPAELSLVVLAAIAVERLLALRGSEPGGRLASTPRPDHALDSLHCELPAPYRPAVRRQRGDGPSSRSGPA